MYKNIKSTEILIDLGLSSGFQHVGGYKTFDMTKEVAVINSLRQNVDFTFIPSDGKKPAEVKVEVIETPEEVVETPEEVEEVTETPEVVEEVVEEVAEEVVETPEVTEDAKPKRRRRKN